MEVEENLYGYRPWLQVPRMRRITVHDHNGKGLMDWLIEGGSDTHWLINAYSEKNAFGVYYKK